MPTRLGMLAKRYEHSMCICTCAVKSNSEYHFLTHAAKENAIYALDVKANTIYALAVKVSTIYALVLLKKIPFMHLLSKQIPFMHLCCQSKYHLCTCAVKENTIYALVLSKKIPFMHLCCQRKYHLCTLCCQTQFRMPFSLLILFCIFHFLKHINQFKYALSVANSTIGKNLCVC